MGNDNWDRINAPPKPPWKHTPITDLETRVNELWGNSMFDWTIGRTLEDDGTTVWFYYAGDLDKHPGKWGISGHCATITDCLIEMIAKHDAQ